jgi:hypothetical protein
MYIMINFRKKYRRVACRTRPVNRKKVQPTDLQIFLIIRKVIEVIFDQLYWMSISI